MFFSQKLLLIGSPVYLVIMILFFLFNDYSISPFIPILPFVYALVFALVYTTRREAFKSIAVSFIFAIWFLRIILIPLIYIFSGYVSHIKVDESVNALNSATLLVSYEFVCVGFLIVLDRKIGLITQESLNFGFNCNCKMAKIVYFVAFFILCISVFCVLQDRSTLAALSTIFDKLFNDASANVERRREILHAYANARMIYSVFMQSIYYLQILIPAILLSLIISKSRTGTKNGLWLCMFLVVSTLVITTDNNIDSVYIMVATGIVVLLVYWQTTRRFIIPISIIGILLIFTFLIKKSGADVSSGTTFFSSISPTLCAYFAALPNVSAGFFMDYEDKFETFIGDIIAGVPYMMAFFKGFPKSVTIYNEVVHGYTGEVNQIVPLITSGYHYFGVLAPLFTILVYEIAFKMELCLRRTKIIFNRILFALIVVNLSTGPCIFGFPNTLKRLCLFLPLILLAFINERVKGSKRCL